MSEQRLRVTIVTLSFNQRPFLARAMRSVLEQDYPVEYIVVDPGSTDGSRDLIERYRGRLARVVLEPDEGPADGLNKAFRLATGEICAYVNADDALLPGAVRRAVSRFAADPSADIVYAHGFIVDGAGRPVRRFRSTRFGRRRCAYGGAVVMQQSTFFRRSAFEDVGGFNAQNRTSWDGELLLDFILAGKVFARVDDYWSIFTVHPQSISGSQARADEYAEDKRRLFVKAMGRAPGRFDRALSAGARIEKWASNPAVLAVRIADLARRPEVKI